MPDEIWKDIEGYEGLYQVSNLGRVRSLDRITDGVRCRQKHSAKLLKGNRNKRGYMQVALCLNGKTKILTIHRLVAKAFIPNPENLPEVNHKDENKTNNVVNNLEWCTKIYNLYYGTAIQRQVAKRSKAVLQYSTDGILLAEYKSITEATRAVSGTESKYAICQCCKGKRQTAYGYIWKYK